MTNSTFCLVPALVAATLLPLSACDDTSEPAVHAGAALCPNCLPLEGGETGDVGGAVTGCGLFTAPAPIEPAEAVALGFDLDEVRRRLARGIDEPLHWHVPDDVSPEDVGGFEPETRIVASFEMGDIVHMRPDPAQCEDGVCRRDGVEVEQDSCAHFLRITVQAEFETLDGAVRASSEGELVQWARGFEDMIGEDTADQFPLHVYADLSEVEGTLTFPEPEGGEPYYGVLALSGSLYEDSTQGGIWPEFFRGNRSELRDRVQPLDGRWGSEPGAESGGVE